MDELTPDQRPEGWTAGAAGYEELFAPFTGPYAADAVRLAGIGRGDRYLDVAAGSGAVSLRVAELGAEVLATDFSPGMVELLQQRFDEAGHDRCRAEVMDGQALDVAGGSFDAAGSSFGVIFFPDRDRGFAELARAVRPGGTVFVSTWRWDGFRIISLVSGALQAALPGLPPPEDPPWLEIGDAHGLARHLVAAGLVDVEVHEVTHHFRPEDPAAFFRALPDWSPPAQPLFEALDDSTIDLAADAFAQQFAEHDDGDGVPVDALIGVGRAPG